MLLCLGDVVSTHHLCRFLPAASLPFPFLGTGHRVVSLQVFPWKPPGPGRPLPGSEACQLLAKLLVDPQPRFPWEVSRLGVLALK